MNEIKKNRDNAEKLRLLVHPAADILTTAQVRKMVKTKVARDVLSTRILRMYGVSESDIQHIREDAGYSLFVPFLIFVLSTEIRKSGR